LQKAEIHAQLDFFHAVIAREFSDRNLSGLIFPLLKQTRNVGVHDANMDADLQQVNVRDSGQ
jgi:hypothetical protein